MYNFLTVNPGDNPNEGRNKINYNFSLISGGTGGGSGLTGDYLSLSGGTVSGDTYFSANLSGETYFSGSTPLTTIIQNIASQYGGLPAGNTYEVQFNGGGFFNASSKFKFNPNDNTLIEGYNNYIYNYGNASNYSTIVGGQLNNINNSESATIIGGKGGDISNNSNASGIFSGLYNYISNSSQASTIIGGAYNSTNYSTAGSLLGSTGGKINNSSSSSIVGGYMSGIYNSSGSTIIGGVGFNQYYPNIQYGVSGGTLIKGSCESVILGGGYKKSTYSYPYTIRYNYPNRIYYSNSSAIMGGRGNCFNVSDNSSIIGSISTCALNSDKISLINSENVIVSANSKNVTIIGSGTKEIPTVGNPGSITVENSNNLLITNSAPIRVATLYGDLFAPSVIKNADGVIANGIVGTYIRGYSTGQTVALDLTFMLAGNIYNSSNIHAKNATYFNAQNSQGIVNFFSDNSYIYNNSSSITDIQTDYSNVNNSIGIFTVNSNNSCTKDSNIIGRFGAINSKIYNSNYSSIINAGFNNAPTFGYSGCSKIYDSNGAMIIGGSETRSYLLGGTFFSPNEINYSDSSSVLFGFGNLISGSSYGCSAFNMIQLGIANKIYDSESVVIFRGDNNYIKSNEKVIVIGSQNSCLNNTQSSVIINGYYAEISNSKHSTVVSSINSYIQNNSYSSALIGGSNNSITCSQSSSIIGGSGSTICTSEHSTVVGSNNYITKSQTSAIIGGVVNTISGSSTSAIIGGALNTISGSSRSAIIGGKTNVLSGNSNFSSIIGGSENTISGSSRSAIIGGQNLSLTNENDTVLVPNLKVSDSISSISGATFFSGITGDYILGTNTVTIINGIITGIV